MTGEEAVASAPRLAVKAMSRRYGRSLAYPVKLGAAVDPLLSAFGELTIDTAPLVEIARNRKAASLLAFVDIAKELPLTLLLRPLNVETLSTHLYGEAARGTDEDGAAAALLIVGIGLVPVILLLRLDRDAVLRRG